MITKENFEMILMFKYHFIFHLNYYLKKKILKDESWHQLFFRVFNLKLELDLK